MSSPETPGTSRYRRPDASMSLLVDMMTNSLDAGYAEATARRAVRGDTGMNKGPAARLLAVVGVALIAMILMIAAMRVHAAAPQAERERHQLVDRIHTDETEVDTLQGTVERLRDEVEAIQELALPKGAKDKVQLLALLSGSDPVEGPGLKVVADDAKETDSTDGSSDPRQAENAADGRILDRDLQRLVNGLWKAGAEAIAINDQRLTALSAIRAAGASILVDNRPLAPPYTILAIGDAKPMQVEFMVGADGRYLRQLQENFGIRVNVAAQKKLKLPAALGTSLRYAAVPGAPPSSPPSSPPATRPSSTPSTTPSGRGSGTPTGSAPPTGTRIPSQKPSERKDKQ
ncbi:DUF881 domain-containing protein [Embleya sp. NBC_00896]|uniref:DUF881 domain-containing protein n=1 Tax=Embleya sp. NBC_00896 TaxID=2975961 RepID=UPI00386459E7|nr:DUF881 domain-containing protein [Embleya sp. NBC_00896]